MESWGPGTDIGRGVFLRFLFGPVRGEGVAEWLVQCSVAGDFRCCIYKEQPRGGRVRCRCFPEELGDIFCGFCGPGDGV